MRRVRLVALPLIACAIAACAPPPAPRPPSPPDADEEPLPELPPDLAASDVEAPNPAEPDVAPDDAPIPAPDGAQEAGPDAAPALPPPVLGDAVRADLGGGSVPRWGIGADGRPILCWAEGGDPGARPARCAVVAAGPAIGTAWELPAGHGAVAGGDGADLLAGVETGTRSLVVFRKDADGHAAWDITFASSDSDTCTPAIGHRFLPGPGGETLLAIAFRHDTHIFGCTDETWLARRDGGGWSAAARAAPGRPAGLFPGVGVVALLTSSGVFRGPGLDGPWTAVPGGDTTAETLRAEGAARSGDRLLAIQSYEYGSRYHVAVLRSPDLGATWPDRIVIAEPEAPVTGTAIAADGQRVVAGWIAGRRGPDGFPDGGGAWLAASPDSGTTWTGAAEVPIDAADAVASLDLIATAGGETAAYGLVAGGDAWDFRGVFVRAVAF